MTDSHKLHLITHCKTLIMRQMGWNESEPLSEQQALELGQQMTEKVGKPISRGELLQFWNEEETEISDQMEMLDTLARFQSYGNWQEFLDTHRHKLGGMGSMGVKKVGGIKEVPHDAGQETLELIHKKNRQLRTWVWVLAVLNLLLLGYLLYRIGGGGGSNMTVL